MKIKIYLKQIYSKEGEKTKPRKDHAFFFLAQKQHILTKPLFVVIALESHNGLNQ